MWWSRLQSFDGVIHLPALRHAGLAYNTISRLPVTDLMAKAVQLASLDLSHNDLCDLAAISSLKALPALRILCLKASVLICQRIACHFHSWMHVPPLKMIQDCPKSPRQMKSSSLSASSVRSWCFRLLVAGQKSDLLSESTGEILVPAIAFAFHDYLLSMTFNNCSTEADTLPAVILFDGH